MEQKKYNAEELAKYFINQIPQKSYTKNVKMLNTKNFSTLRDSLNVTDTESSISTKSVSQNQDTFRNHMKKNSIEIKKDLIKYAEPRWKQMTAIQVPQKILHELNNESDLTDFDEKNLQMRSPSCNSNEDKPYKIDYSFPYVLLIEIEHYYQELIVEFKQNSSPNLSHMNTNSSNTKTKIASMYMAIILDEQYPIADVFQSNKEANYFLIEEFCLFLLLLFIEDYKEGKLTENELTDFRTCISYSYMNFLFLVLLIIENGDSCSNDKINYNKCKGLIEANSSRIDNKKYQLNFHSQNKIIKNVLNNLLTNLSDMNKTITDIVVTIANSAKTKTARQIISTIRGSSVVINKLKKIEANKIKEAPSLPSLPSSTSSSSVENVHEEDDSAIDDDDEKLPKPSVPYLTPKKPNDRRRYTLVLDLDETLVHYFEDENEDNAYVKVRLGTEGFITNLSKIYEIVIFTASTKYYADIVVDGLDSNNLIDFRLYRQHTDPTDGINIKDLSKLGRDLTKVLIIDNIEENYALQPLNGLNISNFEGDENDNELNFLLEDLIELDKKKVEDVRDYLPLIRKKMQERYEAKN